MLLQRFRKLLFVLSNSFYRNALLKQQVAASIEHDGLLRNLGKGIKCVIDIGANRGQFALAARQNFPNAKIYCFEPLLEPAKVLKTLFIKDELVTVNIMAVGEVEAESIIHVSKQDDSSSLLPISSIQSTIYPGTEEKETRVVQVNPLHAVLSKSDIQQPALLKIDVQGFEGEVLKGCKSLLECFSYVYVECSFIPLYSGQSLAHEVVSFMSENKFELTGVYNLSYDGKGNAVQGDFFFTRKAIPLNP